MLPPPTFLQQLLKFLFSISLILGLDTCSSLNVSGQPPSSPLQKVLTLTGEKPGARDLPQDHGANGVWQRLLKLKTTASVLHTQAHPDDEHADLVTYLSRGQGVRSALLSLNRGESGANVLGPELFDQLGLLRTEEFLLAGAYYGLDDLYFTSVADYGFSKRVEEAYGKWGREAVLRDMVRVIRTNRPLVIISRFHGSTRDGHGNHQAAGELTPVAFQMAADPNAFPELAQEGLRPWKALKLYRGGVRPASNEPWNVELNTSAYSPWLGQSYKNFSLLGYSMHRSQVGGNRNVVNGPFKIYYERLQSNVPGVEKENGFFDGIDTSLTGIFTLTGETAPPRVTSLLSEISSDVNSAVNAFQLQNPSAVVPHLARGLSKTRAAMKMLTNQPDALFLLQIKEQQFMDAINAALGVQVQAMAVPVGTKEPRNFFEPQPTMGFVVAGKPLQVNALLLNQSPVAIQPQAIKLLAPGGWVITSIPAEKTTADNDKLEQAFTVTVPDGAPYTQPYFSRTSIQESAYQLQDKSAGNLAVKTPDLIAAASYLVGGEPIEVRKPVQVRQANLPFGHNLYTLKVAPAIAVNLRPKLNVVPLSAGQKHFSVQVELVNNFDGNTDGELSLKVPAGWKVQPAQIPFSFAKAGEKAVHTFAVVLPSLAPTSYKIEATSTANGKSYNSGYDVISYRDLDQTLTYSPSVATVKGVAVNVTKGLRIGYVMGVGDDIPTALQQLGAKVQLLTPADLAAGNFKSFDAIMIGTRAYAVRQDLNTYNQSLLNYTKAGGHLIVLYQTPEFVPDKLAPYPAKLPGNAEEISEEDAPVQILAANHLVLVYPNKITEADFQDWVEQRGSKFFSEWDSTYLPIIASNDQGQAPQRGGWLMARYGAGNYTYFAYALHRQLPYGVPGAYRLLANLISYGKMSKK